MTTPKAKAILDHALAVAMFHEFGHGSALVHQAQLLSKADFDQARQNRNSFWASYASRVEAEEAMALVVRGSQDVSTFLGAFILELLFKAVLAHEGTLDGLVASRQRSKLHDLKFLLDRMTSQSKTAVLDALDMQVMWRGPDGSPISPEDVIVQYADYFTRYRYLYEVSTAPWLGPVGGGGFLLYQTLRIARAVCRLLSEPIPPFLAFPDRV